MRISRGVQRSTFKTKHAHPMIIFTRTSTFSQTLLSRTFPPQHMAHRKNALPSVIEPMRVQPTTAPSRTSPRWVPTTEQAYIPYPLKKQRGCYSPNPRRKCPTIRASSTPHMTTSSHSISSTKVPARSMVLTSCRGSKKLEAPAKMVKLDQRRMPPDHSSIIEAIHPCFEPSAPMIPHNKTRNNHSRTMTGCRHLWRRNSYDAILQLFK